jgi:hypothetical protein
MVSIRKLSINIVKNVQAQDADRLEPKGNVAGREVVSSSLMGTKRHR